MNTRGLVPTPVIDKNGRSTTVHKKVGQVSSKLDAQLRATKPTVPTASSHAAMVASLVEEIDPSNLMLEAQLDSLRDDDLHKVEALCLLIKERGGTEETDQLSDLIQIVGGARRYDVAQADEIRKDLEGAVEYNRIDQGVRLDSTIRFVRGLHYYDEYLGITDRSALQALVDVSVAARGVLNDIDGYDFPEDDEHGEYRDDQDLYDSFFGGDLEEQLDKALWMRNNDSVNVVVENVDRLDQIIEFMSDHKAVQLGRVTVLMESTAPKALLHGAL